MSRPAGDMLTVLAGPPPAPQPFTSEAEAVFWAFRVAYSARRDTGRFDGCGSRRAVQAETILDLLKLTCPTPSHHGMASFYGFQGFEPHPDDEWQARFWHQAMAALRPVLLLLRLVEPPA